MVGLGAGAAGAAFLAACGGGDDKKSGSGSSGGSTALQPKRGGTVRRTGSAQTDGSAGFDPHILANVITDGMQMYYESLVRAKLPDYQVEGSIAQKWETPSPTEVILRLQPGVKFHNKPPVNGR